MNFITYLSIINRIYGGHMHLNRHYAIKLNSCRSVNQCVYLASAFTLSIKLHILCRYQQLFSNVLINYSNIPTNTM